MELRTVILESPYAGNVELNLWYLRMCMRDSLLRGEAPFASHGLYTQSGVLQDEVPDERQRGIDAGFAWRTNAKATVVYTDLGISGGMQKGIEHAQSIGHTIEYRTLGSHWYQFLNNTKSDIFASVGAGTLFGSLMGLMFGAAGSTIVGVSAGVITTILFTLFFIYEKR